MEGIYIRNLTIDKVRHLKNIKIPLTGADGEPTHLLLTGRNGSGKTSVLDALAAYVNFIATQGHLVEYTDACIQTSCAINDREAPAALHVEYTQPTKSIHDAFLEGNFVIAYYRDSRKFDSARPKQIEKVELKDAYDLNEEPRRDFLKYLLDMKMTQALAVTNGKPGKAQQIQNWFDNLEKLLGRIYECDELTLEFDEDTYNFRICMPGREVFDFNTMSSGYAAVIDIVVDLILRMEKQSQRKFSFGIPGIVLIDEIETHLHLSLQKQILGLLTTVFPNIQFVISTHSPFVLNSLDNVTIYDLENRTLVRNGLTDVPYDGIVESYFNVDGLSAELRNCLERYEELTATPSPSSEQKLEIFKLEQKLDEIPDYLAIDVAAEYSRIKLEYRSRK